MQIALTQKFNKLLPLVDVETLDSEVNPLFNWTVNITNVFEDGENDLLVMTNQATRFPILIYNVNETDLDELSVDELSTFFLDKIRETFELYGYNPKVIEAYLKRTGQVSYVKNSDRRQTAWNNQTAQDAISLVGNLYDLGRLDDEYTMQNLSLFFKTIFMKIDETYLSPNERMVPALAALTGLPVFEAPAFELRLTMDMERYQLVREFYMPVTATFADLHEAIQKLMRWENYHLYEFETKTKRLMPIEDAFGEAELADTYQLCDLLQTRSRFTYTYDFGDNWECDITVVSKVAKFSQELPFVKAVEGQSPLEDSGGVWGFLRILEILENPDHPDYREVDNWVGYWNPRTVPYTEVAKPLSQVDTYWL